MSISEQVLEYLKVLVWPVIVGSVLFYLREPLKLKVEQLLKVGVGSMQAEFDRQVAETHERVLKDLVESPEVTDNVTIELTRETPPVPNEPAGGRDDDAGTSGPSADAAAMAEAVRPAAPNPAEPAPARAAPTVPSNTRTNPQAVEAYDPAIKARRLELEIRELERQGNNPMMKMNLFYEQSNQGLITTLKRRLKALDPNSPYLD